MSDKAMLPYLQNETAFLPLLQSLVHALVSLHEQRFFHADIKPGNVMISSTREPPQLKLIDLGCSARWNTKLPLQGTPSYMAPELCDMGPSEKTDVFSFGILLFYCLSGGKTPEQFIEKPQQKTYPNALSFHYQQFSPMLFRKYYYEAFHQILTSVINYNSSLLGEITLQCLDQNPQKRPSFKQIQEKLLKICEGSLAF
ncbi:MAG: hypothetical protein FJZ63_01420 [Chlamydiae bacterium]|nr:hypothetical protein [Chlamydiota bacterium]